MIPIRKIGLLDINESMEFMKLKEELKKLMDKIEKAGGEQNLYNLAKSRPFSVTMYVNEIDKMLPQVETALQSYGSKDQYVSKELSQMKTKLTTLKENIKKCF